MKKVALFLACASASMLITTGAMAAKKTYQAPLQTDQENIAPDVGTHAPDGTGRFTFDDVSKELCGVITFTDLTGIATGVHIHQAPAGDPTADGPVKIEIPPAASPVAFNIKLNASFEQSLTNGELYANVHTATNPKGEIRTTSPWEEDVGGAPVTCPAPTVPLGDAGAPVDAGTTSGGTSTSSSSSSSSSGSDGTSGGTDTMSSSSGDTKADAGAPKKDAGGCNTTSGEGPGPLPVVFLLGMALAGATRLRRRAKR
jgi:MYXO-CTERM domain-containing protein